MFEKDESKYWTFSPQEHQVFNLLNHSTVYQDIMCETVVLFVNNEAYKMK